MEAELIHTMKNHGVDASHKLLDKAHKNGQLIRRERFMTMVLNHVLESNGVPHVEAVLKKMDQQPKIEKKLSLKF